LVPASGDPYLEFSSSAIRGRLLLSERRLREALTILDKPAELVPSLPLRTEYLASQALAHASAGAHERARELAEEATSTSSSSVESKVLVPCVRAITGRGDDLLSEARSLWSAATETGNYDGVVCGYRAYPPLLGALLAHADIQPRVLDIVLQARDERLARAQGARLRLTGHRAIDRLTPREAEVFGLLRSGLTNRAIADELVVSEATVKVHVRHIYEKLGVRTRAEALAQDLGDRGR
jgi:DNA-binding NarL/FixJ family response regulator